MAGRHARVATVPEYQPLRINATGSFIPVGTAVNTSSATTITGGQNNTVTPASMNGIYIGKVLNIANGTGTAEMVTVISITSTTFTAFFANSHSGGYTICSVAPTFLGSITINDPGTAMVLTLMNGCPNTQPKAGAVFAVIKPTAAGQSFVFNCVCDTGLFYTLAGTPGDMTLMYLDG